MSIVLLLIFSQGCSDVSDDNNTSDSTKTDESNKNVFNAITNGILFSGASVLNGAPPKATNNPGDAYLTVPSDTPVNLEPNASGELSIKVNDMPAGQNFNVNVQFGSSTQYIIIPIDNSNGLIENIVNNGGSGTLNIPFSLPPSICDNIDKIQHQIDCYESVDIGGGAMVSKQTARRMLLACGNESGSGDFATGADDYCVDDYPREACSILNEQNMIKTSYKENQTCSSAFPQSTIELNIDYSCSSDELSSSCGACAIENSNRAVDLEYTNIEDVMSKQLENYRLNPEARRSITFTPTEPTI